MSHTDSHLITYLFLGLNLQPNLVQSLMVSTNLARINPCALFGWLQARVADFGWEVNAPSEEHSEFECLFRKQSNNLAFGLEPEEASRSIPQFWLIMIDSLNPETPDNTFILSSTQCLKGTTAMDTTFSPTRSFDSKFDFLQCLTQAVVC